MHETEVYFAGVSSNGPCLVEVPRYKKIYIYLKNFSLNIGKGIGYKVSAVNALSFLPSVCSFCSAF